MMLEPVTRRLGFIGPVVSVHMKAYVTGIPDLLPHNKTEFILIVIVQATDDLMSQKSLEHT